MADLFWFSDEQWARVEPLLPKNTRGLKRVDDRRVLSGTVHVIKSGCRWSEYGPSKTIYNRFVRWAERGIWDDIFTALAGAELLGNAVEVLRSDIDGAEAARHAKTTDKFIKHDFRFVVRPAHRR